MSGLVGILSVPSSRAPGSAPTVRPVQLCAMARRSVRRAYRATRSGKGSAKVRRGHAAFEAAEPADSEAQPDGAVANRAVANREVSRCASVEAVDAPRAAAALRADGASGLAASDHRERGRGFLDGVETAAGKLEWNDGGGHAGTGG